MTENAVGDRAAGPLVRASDRAWRVLVLLALAAFFVVAAVALASVVVPVLLATVVVPVGRPFFEVLDRRVPSSLAAALVLLSAVVALALAGLVMVLSLSANWSELWAGVAESVTVATDWMGDRFGGLDDTQLARADADARELTKSVADTLVGGIATSLGALGSFLVGFVLFLVTFFFGVRDWDRFRGWVIGNCTAEVQPKVGLFLDRYALMLRRYWKAQALVGLFDSIAIWVGLTLIGVPLAGPIAVLTFFISFIPYLGAFISGALAVLVAGALGAIVAIPIVVMVGEARRIFGQADSPDQASEPPVPPAGPEPAV